MQQWTGSGQVLAGCWWRQTWWGAAWTSWECTASSTMTSPSPPQTTSTAWAELAGQADQVPTASSLCLLCISSLRSMPASHSFWSGTEVPAGLAGQADVVYLIGSGCAQSLREDAVAEREFEAVSESVVVLGVCIGCSSKDDGV